MILLEIIKTRRALNRRMARTGWQPSAIEVLVAESRVLPLGRLIKDLAYWRWISVWLSILPPVFALTHVPFMTGCEAYFEFRDRFEYPALGRWHSYRWRKWQQKRAQP